MFEFKGISSTEFGVKVVSKTPMSKSARRYNKSIYYGNYVAEKIVSKNEFLMTECEIIVECDKSKVRDLYSWLEGYGDYIDTDEADKYYKVYAVDAIECNRVNVSDIRQVKIVFKAQPFAYKVDNFTVTVWSGSTILNEGTIIAQPIYYLTGNGIITLKVNMTTKPLIIKDVAGTIVVDTVNMLIYDLDTKINFMNKSTGKLPLLNVGINLIEFTNVSNCEITKNERWL